MTRILVIGAGITGLFAGLVLARRGHKVTLCEHDEPASPEVTEGVTNAWLRPGVPQATSPHIMRALGRNMLRDHLPDVFRRVVEMGATEIHLAGRIPDDTCQPGDEDLAMLACRRPILEAILRDAAAQDDGIDVKAKCKVVGLIARASKTDGVPQIVGVRTGDGEDVFADIVIDVSGRRSQTCRWLEEANARQPLQDSKECGLIYYSRHFQWKPGFGVPADMPTPYGPRGDLGYLGFGTFIADNGFFGLCLMIPTWDSELRVLRGEDAFMAALQNIPALSAFVDPTRSRPVSDVIPFGQLQNYVRRFVVDGRPVALGYHVVGDAFCCTNPENAWGMSLGMEHAVALADVIDEVPDDPLAQALTFDQQVYRPARARYEAAIDWDHLRNWRWRGETVNSDDPLAEPTAFTMQIIAPAAAVDPIVSRANIRASNLLDPPGALLQNSEVVERAKALHARRERPASRPKAGPDRDTFLNILMASKP